MWSSAAWSGSVRRGEAGYGLVRSGLVWQGEENG